MEIKKDFNTYKDDVCLVYREAYSGPPYNTSEEKLEIFETQDWPKRIKEEGFTLTLVKNHEDIVGMAYGWSSSPETYWTDKLESQLGADGQFWLKDNFELVDIAIRPKYQGQGAGKLLYNAIFKQVKHKTALLYTLQSDTAAYKMYLKLGWKVLKDNLIFKSGKSFVLMGKVLD